MTNQQSQFFIVQAMVANCLLQHDALADPLRLLRLTHLILKFFNIALQLVSFASSSSKIGETFICFKIKLQRSWLGPKLVATSNTDLVALPKFQHLKLWLSVANIGRTAVIIVLHSFCFQTTLTGAHPQHWCFKSSSFVGSMLIWTFLKPFSSFAL